MQKIPFLDVPSLHSAYAEQYKQAMQEIVNTGVFIGGEQVTRLAQALSSYLGGVEVVPCANGTDASTLAYLALDLKAGDEVLCPSFNFISSVETAVLLGLKPIFYDTTRDFGIDLKDFFSKLSPSIKAINVSHLFGQSADMEPVLQAANRLGIPVIEDVAQSFGAEYSLSTGETAKLGSFGTLGYTSFFPSKNLACLGDGGALFTKDKALADKLRALANHGQTQRYEHKYIGLNSRLDALQAAFLSIRLQDLDIDLAKRKAIADSYCALLGDSEHYTLPISLTGRPHSYNQFTLLIHQGREELKQYLQENGVPYMIYYPKPLHLQEAYTFLGYKEGQFPCSEELCKKVLSIPMHPMLSFEQVSYIASTIRRFFNR